MNIAFADKIQQQRKFLVNVRLHKRNVRVYKRVTACANCFEAGKVYCSNISCWWGSREIITVVRANIIMNRLCSKLYTYVKAS